MLSTLRRVRGAGVEAKMRCYEMLSDIGMGGGQRVFWTSSLYYFYKENWLCAMTRHHAKSNINILLTRNLGQNSDRGISDFWISGQSLIKRNCHNFKTSYDIDMKLVPVTKTDKRNKTTSKKLTMTSCQRIDVIAIFPIYGQFGAIRKPDSGRIVYKFYIFLNSYLLSYKN